MLEGLVHFLARRVVGDEDLDLAAHVLDVGKRDLAHRPPQHQPTRNLDQHRTDIEHAAFGLLVLLDQFGGKMPALETVLIGKALCAQGLKLGAAFGDELFAVRRRLRRGRLGGLLRLIGHCSGPCRIGSNAPFEAGIDEIVEIPVENGLGIADLHVGSQVLDA